MAYIELTLHYHQIGNPYYPLKARGIPLGVVDPVSGLAAFTPVWDEGFVFGTFSNAPPPVDGKIDEQRIVKTARRRGRLRMKPWRTR